MFTQYLAVNTTTNPLGDKAGWCKPMAAGANNHLRFGLQWVSSMQPGCRLKEYGILAGIWRLMWDRARRNKAD